MVCPIVKDTLGKGINDGWIKVVDRHTSENFTCSVKSRYRNNSGSWTDYWSGNKLSAGFGSHTQTLGFGQFGHVSGGSHYYVVCEIPKKHPSNGTSYIVSYRVDEKT